MKVRISTAMVTAVALAGAAFLILAAPSDARPGASGPAVAEFKRAAPGPAAGEARGECPGHGVASTVPPCVDAASQLPWRTVAQAREGGGRERQH